MDGLLELTYTSAHSSPPRSTVIFGLIVSVRPLENISLAEEQRRPSKKLKCKGSRSRMMSKMGSVSFELHDV